MRTEHGAFVKSMMKIFSNFVAFSENQNFNNLIKHTSYCCPPKFGKFNGARNWISKAEIENCIPAAAAGLAGSAGPIKLGRL